MRLKKYIAENRTDIEKFLIDFLGKKESQVSEKNSHAYTKLKHFATKGKMLRGIFVLLAFDMFKGENRENAIKAAAAIELNHSSLLVHDDIMDNDNLRRGKKSIHAQYIDYGKKANAHNIESFGKGMGLVAGDLGYFMCYELLVTMDLPVDALRKVITQYIQDLETTAIGQFMDFEFAETPHEPSVDEILEMYLNKTGRYTFANPLLVGTLLADATENDQKNINEFGEILGKIFQIKDDELGIFGTEEEIGKVLGSDITENKKTIFRSYFLEKANKKDKEEFLSIFGHEVEEADVERVRSLIDKYNIRTDINSEIDETSEKAVHLIKKMDVDDEYKVILHELVEYNKSRGK